MMTDSNTMSFPEQMALWSTGVAEEVAFWAHWMKSGGDKWPEDFKLRLQTDTEVEEPLKSLIEQAGPDCRILDVGAGPLTCINKQLNGRKLSIDACDPLANAYNQLLHLNGIQAPVRTNFADAEHLSAFYLPSTYDITHCRNALDHSLAPWVGIEEMLRVTKVGGYAVLVHYLNEAEHGSYEGLHQHNFDIRDGRFVIWNKTALRDVEQTLPVKTQIEAKATGGRMFVATIKKLEEFSDVGTDRRHSRETAMLLEYVFDSAITQGMQQMVNNRAA